MQSAESPSSYCRCYQNGTDRCLRKCQSRNDVDGDDRSEELDSNLRPPRSLRDALIQLNYWSIWGE